MNRKQIKFVLNLVCPANLILIKVRIQFAEFSGVMNWGKGWKSIESVDLPHFFCLPTRHVSVCGFFFGHLSPIFGNEFFALLGSLCRQKMSASFISHLIIEHSWTFSSVSCRYCILLESPSIFRGFFRGVLQKSKTLVISQLLVAQKCQNIFASNSFAFPNFVLVFVFVLFFYSAFYFPLHWIRECVQVGQKPGDGEQGDKG